MKTHLFAALAFTLLLNACKTSDPDPAGGTTPIVHQEATYTYTKFTDIVYGTGLSHSAINSETTNSVALELDVYVPENDETSRAAFVFIHGGGFIGGDKSQGAIVSMADYFASRGWVFYSVNYRLRDELGTVPQRWAAFASLAEDPSGQFNAIYPAQRDAKAAMRWIVANASSFAINTDYITVGGGSAGAITAITVGVSESEDFRDELTLEEDPTLSSTNLDVTYQVQTIINFWGSKVALDGLEGVFGHDRFNANDPPMLIVHGTEDNTVLFSEAEDLKAIYESLDIPLAYYPIEGAGHSAWNAVVNGSTIDQLSFDFIVDQQQLPVQ